MTSPLFEYTDEVPASVFFKLCRFEGSAHDGTRIAHYEYVSGRTNEHRYHSCDVSVLPVRSWVQARMLRVGGQKNEKKLFIPCFIQAQAAATLTFVISSGGRKIGFEGEVQQLRSSISPDGPYVNPNGGFSSQAGVTSDFYHGGHKGNGAKIFLNH